MRPFLVCIDKLQKQCIIQVHKNGPLFLSNEIVDVLQKGKDGNGLRLYKLKDESVDVALEHEFFA